MSYHRKSQQKALRGAVGTVQRAADLDVEVPRCTRELGFSSHSSSAGTCIVPPMSWVPAGSFVMGSDRTVDPKAYRDETPQHEARTIAFCMGTYPVTVAEYALAVQQGVAAEPRDFKGITWRGQLRSPDHPVTSISWVDAVAYCLWLGELMGAQCRLATEAEWEKAARGTDGHVYPWGMDWDRELANTPDGGPGRTVAIGDYPDAASPYGVHDMIGNVWEWCNSIYRPYPYSAEDGREEFSLNDTRVLRGSAWYCVPYNARAACRGLGYSGLYLGGGFRVVFPGLSAPPPSSVGSVGSIDIAADGGKEP